MGKNLKIWEKMGKYEKNGNKQEIMRKNRKKYEKISKMKKNLKLREKRKYDKN